MTGQELYETSSTEKALEISRESLLRNSTKAFSPTITCAWSQMTDCEREIWNVAARIGSQEPAPAQSVGDVIGSADTHFPLGLVVGQNWRQCVGTMDIEGCGKSFEIPAGMKILAHLATVCGECSDKLVRKTPEPQRRAAIDRWRDVCPEIYQETELAQIPAHRRRPRQWTGFAGKGLLITGESRLQKTRVMWLMIRDMFESARPPSSFRFFDAVDFGLEWADASGKFEAKRFVESVASADIVFFDDLGKAELSATARAALFGVIEKRCSNKLPILATTNCTGETLAAGMDGNRGEPFVSRLREFCDCYKFTKTETIGPV